jgi:hypothetical protein
VLPRPAPVSTSTFVSHRVAHRLSPIAHIFVDDDFFDRPDLFRDHRLFVTLNDLEFPPLKSFARDIRATRCGTPLDDDSLVTKLDFSPSP